MLPRRRVLALGGLVVAGAAGGVSAVLGGRRSAAGDAPAELRIATGPPGGVFREIGAALASALASRLPKTRIRLVYTDASVDNLALLGRADAELAFAALDTVEAAIAAGRPRDVTAVARLFDSWMQVLVLVGSPLRRLADVDGRPVAAGASGSGTRFTTERLVALAQLRPTLVTATQDEGAAALRAGRVDALFTFTGVPTPAVSRLVRETAVRLLPLDGYGDGLVERFGPVYHQATLPSTAYDGVAGIETVTTPNLLLARPDLPDRVVETVAQGLFAERARMAVDHPEANQINVRTAVATMPVPLHPGALAYYRSTKPYVG
jgi:TRAP transporter TAXI family solute receptor